MEKAGKVYTISDKQREQEVSGDDGVDFETALSATGFGKFNFFLILISIPAALSPMFETTTMSLVFPAAQCDLDLSLQNKGTLNAVTYLGMITSGVIWGFLADTLGRKKLLVIGYFLDAAMVLCSAFSQTFEMLAIFKYFGGFIINGPFAVLTSYISEFHSAKYRTRLQLILGMVYSLANIILPIIAWIVYDSNPSVQVFDFLTLYNWNFFLFFCTLPSILAGIGICFLPESPKFLMTAGRNEEALKIFKKVYALNSGKSPDTYHINALVDEVKQISKQKSKKQALHEGLKQLKPLIQSRFLSKFILVCLIQTCIVTGLNTIRLWLPQIFIAMANYESGHSDETSSLCDMLSMVQANVTVVDGSKKCDVEVGSMSAYINTIIVGLVCIASYILTAFLVNVVRKKLLLVVLSLVAAGCSIGLYLSRGTPSVLVLSSVFHASAGVASNVMISITVEMFPTTLRTIVVATIMMTGRIGALSGNLLFPVLLDVGCLPPFLMTGIIFLICSITSLLLPKTDMKALE